MPAFLLLSLVGQAFPKRRTVTLDGRQTLTAKQVQDAFESSLAPNILLLITLTPQAGGEVVRVLEELLEEGRLPWSTADQSLPNDFRLLVHSPTGLFPFYEHISLRLRV